VAGALWLVCIICFLGMRFAGPIMPIVTSSGGPPGGTS
jgi:hypothetical protein